jgi:hypothetical protein
VNRKHESGVLRIGGMIVVLFGAAALLLIYYRSHKRLILHGIEDLKTEIPSTIGGPILGRPGGLPDIAEKPKPVVADFKGCPPEGDGGDPDLNRLKNRTDRGDYVPVRFDAVVAIAWPKGVERRVRANWSPDDTAEVHRYEGVPISVEGYLAGARQEGPESPNCHGADPEFRDFHIWLTGSPDQDRSSSIIVETTPRVREKHPNWRTDVLGTIVKSKERVRISGWLLLDPEHPDQVGKTRGTIWEIHPVMQIEVKEQGKWTPLDNWRR